MDQISLIRKQTDVRCDEPGCGWSLTTENALEWHNKSCPKCGKGVIVNDEEAELFREILAISEPDRKLNTEEKKLFELSIDTAIFREAQG